MDVFGAIAHGFNKAMWAFAPNFQANRLRKQDQREFAYYLMGFGPGVHGYEARAQYIERLASKAKLTPVDLGLVKRAWSYRGDGAGGRSSDAELLALYKLLARHPQLALFQGLAHDVMGTVSPRYVEHKMAAAEALVSFARANPRYLAVADDVLRYAVSQSVPLRRLEAIAFCSFLNRCVLDLQRPLQQRGVAVPDAFVRP